ncbi:hypothetical protein ACFE04_004645 [Oxalis oulophora]
MLDAIGSGPFDAMRLGLFNERWSDLGVAASGHDDDDVDGWLYTTYLALTGPCNRRGQIIASRVVSGERTQLDAMRNERTQLDVVSGVLSGVVSGTSRAASGEREIASGASEASGETKAASGASEASDTVNVASGETVVSAWCGAW